MRILKTSAPALIAALLITVACTHTTLPEAGGTPAPHGGGGLAARAQRVTITRDDWGIAHVHGPTDADAVFGMIYAQAEDDFNRVETNYLKSMGRLAEAEGESAIFEDLRMKLFIDPDEMKRLYASSPAWLKALMDGWADGLNYFLQTHPDVKPRVITRFEPWMALTFSEGSIGGDIESISVKELAAFYGKPRVAAGRAAFADDPGGSNGFAISPLNTRGGNALLLINPHTSFFFRSELQMTSDEGLNAYGAATWGQFFIYQGFNERAGWMHTSSGVDVIDEFLETIVDRDGRLNYRYGSEERPVATSTIVVPYRTPAGMAQRTFTVYRTHHGPIVRELDAKWVSVALMNKPVEALSQSFLRTKARTFAEFTDVMKLKANSSNNTIYADGDGNIAYFHPHFIPKRDDRFDYTRPVDGSDPATDWKGLHEIDEAPLVVNPATGWIQNTNNWPYSAAGPFSPKREDFPRYMDTAGENPRGIHAVRVLEGRKDFTLDGLVAAAYDTWLPAFEKLVPLLVRAYDAAPASAEKESLGAPIDQLRGWDYRWSVDSIPTSLAVYWVEELWGAAEAPAREAKISRYDYIAERVPPARKLEALAAAVAKLERDFGTWRTPWGEINRFQRLTGDITHRFDDRAPSIPVGFPSALWGSLASFQTSTHPDTKKRYGIRGNSFVAVVEFGQRVRARAVTAGGESGDPASPHFNDQAARYATGNLREV
ncbi:MAG TPA: penicillin acylase family protein [Thermoanaerobaculia bacterium]|nr:penicillin acylase family protein [Thermoanaerobaculia bacterium]